MTSVAYVCASKLAEQRISMARMDPELHVTLLNGGLTAFCYQAPTFASYVHQRNNARCSGHPYFQGNSTYSLSSTVLISRVVAKD